MGDQENILLIFTDDILVLMSDPQKSVPPLLELVNSFSDISGYKINWSKSEVMPSSKYYHKFNLQHWKFQWVPKYPKYLGILLNPGLENMIPDNFHPIFLTHQAIKMVIAPKLNYPPSMLPLSVPGNIFQIIDKMFNQFIWAGKRARMKLTRLQA